MHKSLIQPNSKLENISKMEEWNSKRYSQDKFSPVKSAKFLKHSVSKGELSTNYSKIHLLSAKTPVNAHRNIGYSKTLARESINNLNSPKRSVVTLSVNKFKENSLQDVADEVTINTSKCFMDEYYASNGYFSFSVNREELREKDNYQDRLKTFVDEKLLEIAGKISVKQRGEEEKLKNIDKLENLRNQIGMNKI